MLMPAAMVSAGTILGEIIPARFLGGFATTRSRKAAASLGVGFLAFMLGAKFVGKKNAEYLALGAMSAGIS